MSTGTAEPPIMSKKKAPTPPTGNYFTLRLATEYWHVLQAITRKTSRPMATEAEIALEQRARRVAAKFKANHPEDV